MGEKRKARMTNNERTSKKEKKSNKNTVLSSASNDEIEEQSSMHSNSSNSDSNSQQTSIGQENTNPEEIDVSQMIPSIDVETVIIENSIESTPSTMINNEKISNELAQTTIPVAAATTSSKSWWSSFIRFFHFGSTSTTENKSSLDHSNSTLSNGSYLSNVKCRRSLHGDSLVG